MKSPVTPTREPSGPATAENTPSRFTQTKQPVADLTTQRRVVYSYSALNCYARICPHQYFHRYIERKIPFASTPAVEWGNKVHSALEAHIGKGKVLPEEMRQWEGLARPFLQMSAKVEIKLAIANGCFNVDFWDNSAWLRGKVDCAIIDGEKAFIADWKTGKRREEPFELEIGALLLAVKIPKLTSIRGCYVWLQEGSMGETYDLSDFKATYEKCVGIIRQIEQDQTFEKRPGPLCAWCEVKSCEFNRKEN